MVQKARGRRRKRKQRPLGEELEQHYLNPLTLPLVLSSGLLFGPIALAPVLFPAVNRLPAWTAIPILLGYLAVFSRLGSRGAFHLHWFVGRNNLRSVQPLRGGPSITQAFENRDFVSLTPHGPFVIVCRASGERHTWPRWLRSRRRTYRWELQDGRLRLRGTRA